MAAAFFALTPRAQGQAAQTPFTRSNALAKIGASKGWSLFALQARIPATWQKSSNAQTSDPRQMARLQLEDRAVPTGYMLGKQQYYKHPIFALLWLRAPGPGPAARQQALLRFTRRTLKNLLLQGVQRRWPVTWQPPRYGEYPLPGGRRLAVLMQVGGSRPSPYVAPLALSLVTAMVVDRGSAAVFATGLTSGNTFSSLSGAARQRVMRVAGLVAQQAMSVAALARIRLPSRHRALERRLARRRRFLHASRWASSMGTLSRSSFAQSRRLEIRFLPGQRCTIRDDFSTSYQHAARSLDDAPGTDPRLTQGAGGGRRATPPARYEVRRGRGGAHWLVVYLPARLGGPTFYSLQASKRRRCGRKTIRGLAIDGKVEGLFSTFRGWCVYRSSRSLR